MEEVNIIELTYIKIAQWNPPKIVLSGRRRKVVKKEQYRWDEFDQSALYACCECHNETPMYNSFMLIKNFKQKVKINIYVLH
jgi:hypothetical protein